jgi:hypothetical protein
VADEVLNNGKWYASQADDSEEWEVWHSSTYLTGDGLRIPDQESCDQLIALVQAIRSKLPERW